jgi:predicted nucleic acid-binding protein
MDALVKGLDTTLLVYALDFGSPLHKRAAEILAQSIRGEWAACVCDTTILELCEILSDSRRVRHVMSAEQLDKIIDRLTKHPQPQVLYSDAAIAKRALKLMQKHSVLGGKFTVAHIAATLLEHGVKTIITADSTSFQAVRELNVENPFETLFV